MERIDGRALDALREVKYTLDYISCAEGSVLIEMGNTKVICNATIEDKIPKWMKDKKTGWVTAEYNMLPRATSQRTNRERSAVSGRTQEIQRLIGRSLRGVCDLTALKEKTILIDCDVIQADGGTRTASIVGGFVALAKALQKRNLAKPVLKTWLSATSVGIYKGQPILDLCYEEDLEASVDMNVVMTHEGEFVEIQGTGEEATFTKAELDAMLELAQIGCQQHIELQKKILGGVLP